MPSTVALSATELSRLHRQRRLESRSAPQVVVPRGRNGSPHPSAANFTANSSSRSNSIQRRKKQANSSSKPMSNEGAGNKTLVNASISYSFDDEITAANTSANAKETTTLTTVVAVSAKTTLTTTTKPTATTPSTSNNKLHTRSLSCSSFSMPATPQTPTNNKNSNSNHNSIVAVTPDSTMSNTSSSSSHQNQASPVVSSSLGFFLDSRAARGTPKRKPGCLSRSNSTKSMPLALTDAHSTSTTASADAMPMDELKSKVTTISSSRGRMLPPSQRRSLLDTPLLTASASEDDDDEEEGDDDNDHSGGQLALLLPAASNVSAGLKLHRMAEALQLQSSPMRMTADEQHLWDVVQDLLLEVSEVAPSSTTAATTNANANTSPTYWEQKCRLAESEFKEQQHESDRAVRAMQRVLADVTTEREETMLQLRGELERTQEQSDDTILKLTQKLKEMQQKERKNEAAAKASSDSNETAKAKDKIVADLKLQLEEALQQDTQVEAEEMTAMARENEQQAQEIAGLKEQMLSVKAAAAEVAAIEDTAADNSKSSDQEDLVQELQEKSASLENAKMIITSLENANGSLARELRAKLKEKEDELSNLTSTSADRKRTLDSLATELRELQRNQQKPRLSQKQLANQKSLCQLLEKNVRALRQAAVQHEARNDQQSVDQISQIVSETFTFLKHNLESWESYLKNMDVPELQDGNDGSSAESALKKKHDETNALRKELERVTAESTQEKEQLKDELNAVMDQYDANVQMLETKGRELSVLKDSLDVENSQLGGYISDDGTDAFDETETMESPDDIPKMFTGSLLLNRGAGVDIVNPNAAEMSGATAAEIQMLKNEIVQRQKERESTATDLQAEKESLANAKMIISSLEKANKSMLEDLRSRLQDSNTAIASLLEKSMEHEKTIDSLRKEIKALHQEQEKESQQADARMAKLRDENLVFSMRLATKEIENEDLHENLSHYEGHEVPISKMRLTSVEEKKEDPASGVEFILS